MTAPTTIVIVFLIIIRMGKQTVDTKCFSPSASAWGMGLSICLPHCAGVSSHCQEDRQTDRQTGYGGVPYEHACLSESEQLVT